MLFEDSLSPNPIIFIMIHFSCKVSCLTKNRQGFKLATFKYLNKALGKTPGSVKPSVLKKGHFENFK